MTNGCVCAYEPSASTWVPGVLAGLGLALVIEEPDELKDALRELAATLLTAASQT